MSSLATLDIKPRTLREQKQWIEDRSGLLSVLVAEKNGVVVGFAALSFYRSSHGYRSSVENSIYIAKDQRGNGLGTMLLDKIIESAHLQGFHSLFARVSTTQESSLQLHTKRGFETVGIEREVGRKFGKWRDVTIMQLLLRNR